MNELQKLLDAKKMESKSQASQAIVPALNYSSGPAQALSAHRNDAAMKEKELYEYDLEQLSGFIFMCNGRTKPQCYQFRVFGLPVGKMEVVKKIKPGMKLFLYDFELKLLYGIYEATSVGTLNLEETAFDGRFAAQVGFKIYKDCLPLHESSFRHAVEHYYLKGFKFNQELNKQQVSSLLSLFRPLTASAACYMHPMPHQAVENQSSLPYVQQTGLQQYDCYGSQLVPRHFHPGMNPQVPHAVMDTNAIARQQSYVQPISVRLHSAPSQQQQYYGSTINMGYSHPTMITQVSMQSDGHNYMAAVPEPYVPGNPTQTVPDQYNRYGTMGIDEQLGTGDKHPTEEENYSGENSFMQYHSSNQSLASSGSTQAANRAFNYAYSYLYAGAAPAHHHGHI